MDKIGNDTEEKAKVPEKASNTEIPCVVKIQTEPCTLNDCFQHMGVAEQ